MSIPSPPGPNGRSTPGISESIRETLGAGAAFVAARAQLLRIESAQAGARLLGWAIAGVGVLVCGAIGYAALVFSAIAGAADRWFAGHMAVPALIAGGLHLLASLGLVLWLRRRFVRQRFFVATREEFTEDHQWLFPTQKSPH